MNQSATVETTESFVIPKGIRDFIFKYRFKDFLKAQSKPFSGDTCARIERYITDDADFYTPFENFVVEEVSNGKNRQVFMCDFSIESLKILGLTSKIRERLASKGFRNDDFNNLLVDKEHRSNELIYLKIFENEKGNPVKISMSFINHEIINNETEDGIVSVDNYNYTWIDIYPEERYLQIKVRPYSGNYFMTLKQGNATFEFFHELMKSTFDIYFLEMTSEKEVLYNIFKKLTKEAEEPYRNQVQKNSVKINEMSTELAELVGISDLKNPVDVPNRISRLLERSLILNDLEKYKAYDPNKLGIIDRIDFSDQSGAKVNANAQEEGIEIADIYFDTRETLDEIKQLNKVWITWFIRSDDVETMKVYTSIEVLNNRLIIFFLSVQTAPMEVQDYVLSLFRRFKIGEIS